MLKLGRTRTYATGREHVLARATLGVRRGRTGGAAQGRRRRPRTGHDSVLTFRGPGDLIGELSSVRRRAPLGDRRPRSSRPNSCSSRRTDSPSGCGPNPRSPTCCCARSRQAPTIPTASGSSSAPTTRPGASPAGSCSWPTTTASPVPPRRAACDHAAAVTDRVGRMDRFISRSRGACLGAVAARGLITTHRRSIVVLDVDALAALAD